METLARVIRSSVFLTGHTGFKGSWLSLWLKKLGAAVHGYALEAPSTPSLFALAHVERLLDSHRLGDIREGARLCQAMRAAAPRLVIHMAAQPLVRRSYHDPVETWACNVMGTVNVLEAARRCPSVKAVVIITTDKCYENKEWAWGYREVDALGGHDPYSASKAACELAAASYRKSFFERGGPLMATARAGNVIGGGDYAEDRLLADAARAAAAGKELIIRNPEATRPWQHVLCALHGYLLLAEGLLAGREELAAAFNFGPPAEDNMPVKAVLEGLQGHWPELAWRVERDASAPHEANVLYLDSSRARQALGWHPLWTLEKSLSRTAAWYRAVQGRAMDAAAMTQSHIAEYMADAQEARP